MPSFLPHSPTSGQPKDASQTDIKPVGASQSGLELLDMLPPADRNPHLARPGPGNRDDIEARAATPSHEGARSELRASTDPTRRQLVCIVLGLFCLTLPTYGLMSAWGLFQVYWLEHQLAGSSPTNVAWIGSVFGFMDCLFGIVVGSVFDHRGTRVVLPLGCAVYWACFLALSWCSTYDQFMACLIVAGISAAVPTTMAFCAIDHWFTKHRATVTGLVSTGAPIGGILFSLALKGLFSRYNWQISMYWLSSTIGFFMLLGSVLVESKPQERVAAAAGDFGHLRHPSFLCFTFCVFVFEYVLFTQWGSLPWFAALTGLGDIFFLQMTYNIGAIVGRTIPPWQATKWGPFNIILLLTVLTILTIFGVWIPMGDHNAASLYIVAFFMGIGTGGFVPLTATCLSSLCGDRGYGKWLGSSYTIVSFALLIGNPANQAILESGGPRISVASQGILLVIALFGCLLVRWICLDKRWKWLVKV